MGNITKFINMLMVGIATTVGLYIYYNRDPGLPDYYRADHYWGPKLIKDGDPLPKDDSAVRPFKIEVSEALLNDLKARLKNARISDSFSNENFDYGLNSKTLRTIQDYWLSKYDWRKQERLLNNYNHFKTQIEGLDIHYMHIKADKSARVVYPLLLAHGWPGSIVEFQKLIPLLSQAQDGIAFELVVPSIPGYGWSEAAHRPGLNAIHVGRIYAKLMSKIGHEHFYYHGGDWGALIGKAIGTLVPQRCRGLHTTMPVAKVTPYSMGKILFGWLMPGFVYDFGAQDAKLVYPIFEKLIFLLKESGYFHIQATKPDTVGAALSDSPLGLAAYIIEKFSAWTDPTFPSLPDGGITKKYTMDELLTNVMVYWVTNSITSSQRFYKENVNYHMTNEINFERVAVPEDVPVAVAAFPNELIVLPQTLLHEVYWNITQFNHMPRGGHFAAFEEPELVAQDIRVFINNTFLVTRARRLNTINKAMG